MFLDLIWLVPVLPLLGAAFNGLLGRTLKLPPQLISLVACGTVLGSLLISAGAVYQFATEHWPEQHTAYRSHSAGGFPHSFEWLPGGQTERTLGPEAGHAQPLRVLWSYQLDQLSSVMILVVTFVGFWIHVFAIGYMAGDPGLYRFFAYMNLFMFMMLTLVLGSNLPMMFVGWEGVGLCSYLLIGYYFDRKEAAYASMKAFVVNRIGDFGFMLAMFGLFAVFGTFQFTEISQLAAENRMLPQEAFGSWGLASWLALGLFVGATGKSAQIPLYVWLPDAMAGPTPVSALIHAATMVTAGVYIVTRANVIFQKSPTMMFVVAVVGIATAIWAALIAFSQNDIKKVLAYSTISQLGYMFLACGVGAFSAGIFHLYTHAFFKALMFLGAGSVIFALHHEQDMQRMGGLQASLPKTYKTFLAGWLAICGVPIFAGFFSKDEILWRTFSTHQIPGGVVLWLLGLVGALCTAFYMTRLMALTFWGETRFGKETGHGSSHGHDAHAHGGTPREPPPIMTGPLMVLAAGAVFSGFIGWPQALGGSNFFEHWLEPIIYTPTESSLAAAAEAAHDPTEYVLMGASVVLSLAVIFLARTLYLQRRQTQESLVRAIQPLYQASVHKFWVDEIYETLFVRGITLGSAGLLWKTDARAIDGGVNGTAWLTVLASKVSGFFDKYVVDLLVNLVGWIARIFSMLLRAGQTGFAQNYALVIASSIFAITLVYIFLK